MQDLQDRLPEYSERPPTSVLVDKRSRVLAIHQPNYLPWPGYFFKLYASDCFIFLDDVEYTKRSLTKRTFIRKAKHSQEKSYLTVPLRRHPDSALISELLIDHGQNWPHYHLNKVRNTYAGAPFFQDFFPKLEQWMRRAPDFQKLADWNIFLIRELLQILDIHTPLRRSSSLPVSGDKSGYNFNLVNAFEGQCYISGTGARKYQNEKHYREAGVELVYSDWLSWARANPYQQAEGPWLNGLSILDALFNIGPAALIDYFRAHRDLIFS